MGELALFPFVASEVADEGPGWSGKTSVYRLYDRGGCLLYVGVTSTGTTRLAQHRHGQPWFDEVATASLEHHETRHEALVREAWAIRNEHPIYNKALNHTPGTHRCEESALLSAKEHR